MPNGFFVFYVIDAKTSEVLYHMDGRYFPVDITESDKPAEVAKTAAEFPVIAEKEVQSDTSK